MLKSEVLNFKVFGFEVLGFEVLGFEVLGFEVLKSEMLRFEPIKIIASCDTSEIYTRVRMPARREQRQVGIVLLR